MHVNYGAWGRGVAALLMLAMSSRDGHPEPAGATESVDCRVAASIQQVASVSVDATDCNVLVQRPGRYEFRGSHLVCRSNGSLKVSVAPLEQTGSSPAGVPPKCRYALLADGAFPAPRDWLPAEPGVDAAIELKQGEALTSGQAVDLWIAIETTSQTSVAEAGFHLRADVMLLDQTPAVVP